MAAVSHRILLGVRVGKKSKKKWGRGDTHSSLLPSQQIEADLNSGHLRLQRSALPV